MIFSEEDKAVMTAAIAGIGPNDFDADPGDPEHGPAPDIQRSICNQIGDFLDHLFHWVDTGKRDWPFFHDPREDGAYVKAMNDMAEEYLFELRLERS